MISPIVDELRIAGKKWLDSLNTSIDMHRQLIKSIRICLETTKSIDEFYDLVGLVHLEDIMDTLCVQIAIMFVGKSIYDRLLFFDIHPGRIPQDLPQQAHMVRELIEKHRIRQAYHVVTRMCRLDQFHKLKLLTTIAENQIIMEFY